MLHPNQFQVDEAWIVFKLNDRPIHTEQDGDFDVFAIMDAASCFILSSALVSAKGTELSQLETRCLLEQGQEHKKRWPKTLFVPSEQPGTVLTAEAEAMGIRVVRISEDQLLPIIGEARQGFVDRFG